MDKIKESLKGKKAYILLALAFIAVWVDYFTGLGISQACNEVANDDKCTLSLKEALNYSFLILTGSSFRAAISKAER